MQGHGRFVRGLPQDAHRDGSLTTSIFLPVPVLTIIQAAAAAEMKTVACSNVIWTATTASWAASL